MGNVNNTTVRWWKKKYWIGFAVFLMELLVFFFFLNKARVIGVWDLKVDLVDSCLEETGGLGVDIVIDAGGKVQKSSVLVRTSCFQKMYIVCKRVWKWIPIFATFWNWWGLGSILKHLCRCQSFPVLFSPTSGTLRRGTSGQKTSPAQARRHLSSCSWRSLGHYRRQLAGK